MTIQEMKERKRELGYSYEQLAELSGIPCSTLQKIFGGTTRYPRRVTVAALEKALTAPRRERERNSDVLMEAGGKYDSSVHRGTDGKISVIDYFHFPSERGRCELIDGIIYDMASPSAEHQGMSLRLASRFLQYVDENEGDCRVFTAPFDVIPDPADKFTVVQPDVLIVCDPGKLRRGFCEGAPDLIIEILSPSTRRRDLMIKHAKYASAGVREYWIVDIDARTVVVYDFEHESLPKICGFDMPVPVGIWNGRCTVDFADILAKL